MSDTEFMRRAIELSRERMADGQGGYCATLVVKDGEVVGEGWNTVSIAHDPAGQFICQTSRIHDSR